jgi:histidinol dehydrogenase
MSIKIKQYNYPCKHELKDILERKNLSQESVNVAVREILSVVRKVGDKAVIDYNNKFSNSSLTSLLISRQEIMEATNEVSDSLKEAINLAKENIEKYHAQQNVSYPVVETSPGVKCWQKCVGIDSVGLYVPGGSAPLISTVLMLGIPARLAGCKEIVMCTPANDKIEIHPAILYTANLLGIKNIFKAGGAQAIAAMAYGTESIPRVNKIFGPGNQYVTAAKQLVSIDNVAIDMPAGPSEVLVIADENANSDFIAADLLSQAEHGADSQVVFLTNSEDLISRTLISLEQQLKELPRREVASKSLENSVIILTKDLMTCLEISNEYAPEHLILNCNEPVNCIEKITNAGSVFIGKYTPESAGDYASGTNHTLPTNGFAKMYSGLSVESFCKKITFQKITEEGLQNIGPAIEKLAEAEQLMAHKNAISIRLKEISNE